MRCISLYVFYLNTFLVNVVAARAKVGMGKAGNTNLSGKLSTVDLLNKVVSFVKK
jgi:hypothetical protein